MEDFLGFTLKVMILFIIFWWIGVNFFKHSNEIAEWIKKRRLQKLADENREKIVNMNEVFKEQFGFLETPEYVKERLEVIKKTLADPKGEHVSLNALEFIFLIDQLHSQILKTDRGVYIVSKKNIKELLYEQEKDTLAYARKIREYALRFLPKEGEPIVLNADEVLYWIRNGMLRRPRPKEGNRIFEVKSSMHEVYLNVKEDFIEPHYSLEIVEHADFKKIKKRRDKLNESIRVKNSIEPLPQDELVEGRLVLFSDNTRRIKIGEEVIITDVHGKTWKEDLKGNRIDETKERQVNNKKATKDSFSKKNKDAGGEESNDEYEEIEAKTNVATYNGILMEKKENKGKQENSKKENQNQNKSTASTHLQKTSNKKSQQKEESTKKESKNLPNTTKEKREEIKFPTHEELLKQLRDKENRTYLFNLLKKEKELFGIFLYGKKYSISEKGFLDAFSSMLTETGKNNFASSIKGRRDANNGFLRGFYQELEKLSILDFQKDIKEGVYISFKKGEKRYTIKSLFLDSKQLGEIELEMVTPVEVELKKDYIKSDVYINFNGLVETSKEEEKDKQDGSSQKKTSELLKEDKPDQKKKNEDENSGKPEVSNETKNTSIATEDRVLMPKVTQKSNKGKEVKNNKNDLKLKERMSRKVFLEKFCTVSKLFSEETFESTDDDCSKQFYYTCRVREDNPEEAEVFFNLRLFIKKLSSFLNEENVEFGNSKASLRRFLEDDNKGEISTRFFYTMLDKVVIKTRVVGLSIPLDLLEGLRTDIGYRGGYRANELKNVLEDAKKIGDSRLVDELEMLSIKIDKEIMIDCTKK